MDCEVSEPYPVSLPGLARLQILPGSVELDVYLKINLTIAKMARSQFDPIEIYGTTDPVLGMHEFVLHVAVNLISSDLGQLSFSL